MGKINMSGGGSHVNLKVITAQADDIVEGKTGINPKGKPLPGTLKLTGNMTAADLLPGKTGYSTNPKEPIAGAMPTQGAKTITPGASAQKVAAGRYLTGDITVPGFVMPSADVIKKGAVVEIYGRKVTGKWEGYVAEPTDLYLRGNNKANFSYARTYNKSGTGWIGYGSANFESNMIATKAKRPSSVWLFAGLLSGKAYNLSGYKKLNIECQVTSTSEDNDFVCKLFNSAAEEGREEIRSFYKEVPTLEAGRTYTVSIDINYDGTRYIGLNIDGPVQTYIYRIWLS